MNMGMMSKHHSISPFVFAGNHPSSSVPIILHEALVFVFVDQYETADGAPSNGLVVLVDMDKLLAPRFWKLAVAFSTHCSAGNCKRPMCMCHSGGGSSDGSSGGTDGTGTQLLAQQSVTKSPPIFRVG